MCYLITEGKYFQETYERYTPISINYAVVLICLGNPLLKIIVNQSKLSSGSVIHFQIIIHPDFFNYKKLQGHF